jgi:ABC-type antimicrobial peptide transport system permease subunit
MVIGRTLRLLGGGLELGVGAALLASRLLVSLVHGVASTDPASYALAALLVAAVALGVSLASARAAARVDPIRALRSE